MAAQALTVAPVVRRTLAVKTHEQVRKNRVDLDIVNHD
jgi:hypothetical protein